MRLMQLWKSSQAFLPANRFAKITQPLWDETFPITIILKKQEEFIMSPKAPKKALSVWKTAAEKELEAQYAAYLSELETQSKHFYALIDYAFAPRLSLCFSALYSSRRCGRGEGVRDPFVYRGHRFFFPRLRLYFALIKVKTLSIWTSTLWLTKHNFKILWWNFILFTPCQHTACINSCKCRYPLLYWY